MEKKDLKIGLVIVGDEILSGRRQDRHLTRIIEILSARNLSLNWCRIVGDDMDSLVQTYQQTYEEALVSDCVVLSTGGIGMTPDDMTRQAAAAAMNLELEYHTEGLKLVEELARSRGVELKPAQKKLIEFPVGCDLIPNPVNTIPGFSINQHYFVPGFPEMAWPMLEWVLDQYYADAGNSNYREVSYRLEGVNEGILAPVMEHINNTFPTVSSFSLPTITKDIPRLEFGVKGDHPHIDAAQSYVEGLFMEKDFTWTLLK